MSHTLPDCFIPIHDVARVLAHTHEGLTIPQDAQGYLREALRSKLVEYQTGPTAGNGYLLTANGLEALYRYVEANTTWRRDQPDVLDGVEYEELP